MLPTQNWLSEEIPCHRGASYTLAVAARSLRTQRTREMGGSSISGQATQPTCKHKGAQIFMTEPTSLANHFRTHTYLCVTSGRHRPPQSHGRVCAVSEHECVAHWGCQTGVGLLLCLCIVCGRSIAVHAHRLVGTVCTSLRHIAQHGIPVQHHACEKPNPKLSEQPSLPMHDIIEMRSLEAEKRRPLPCLTDHPLHQAAMQIKAHKKEVD
eukprot:scaffold18749_cov17-Tisochrysis_lutea.AAC.1